MVLNPKNNLPQAKQGEDLAAFYLRKKNYRILARNFRSRTGEIDITAILQNTLVFIEVKSRWSTDFGSPLEAVTPKKIKSIIRTAQYFKLLNPQTPDLMRIDVIGLDYTKEPFPLIEHIENVSG